MVKRADGWQEVEWEEALHIAAQAIAERVKEQGADQLGMLASPGATLEELALFNQLAEGLGVSNIDHRLRQTDFTGQEQQPVFPFLGQTIEELEQANAILVVGGNLRKDQPIIGHRVRKAAKAGASVMMINPVDYPLTYKPAHQSVVTPSHMVQSLSGVAAALLQSRKARAPEALQAIIEQTLPNDTEQAMAATLADAENATVLLGLLDPARYRCFNWRTEWCESRLCLRWGQQCRRLSGRCVAASKCRRCRTRKQWYGRRANDCAATQELPATEY